VHPMFTPVVRAFALLAGFGFFGMAQAQSGIGVAGFGYRTPANTITAAPGQFLIVSVFGIAPIPNPPAAPPPPPPSEATTRSMPSPTSRWTAYSSATGE